MKVRKKEREGGIGEGRNGGRWGQLLQAVLVLSRPYQKRS